MTRAILTILLLLLAGPALGAEYFVDSTTGDDGNVGSLATPWCSLQRAVERGGLTAGSVVWVRRVHREYDSGVSAPAGSGGDITPNSSYDGTMSANIEIIGWPRGETVLSGTTWTESSVTVFAFSGISNTMMGRYVTAPNDEKYLVTYVPESATTGFVIDRPYPGSTATDTGCTLWADEDYNRRPAAAAWDADWNGLPLFDFQGASYNLTNHNLVDYWHWKNLAFGNSSDGNGILDFGENLVHMMTGCSVWQPPSINVPLINMRGSNCAGMFRRIVAQGGRTNSSSQLSLSLGYGTASLTDSALFGAYRLYVQSGGPLELYNVNLGVEEASYSTGEILLTSPGVLVLGKDVRFGKNPALTLRYSPSLAMRFENYQKELGKHYTINAHGTVQSVAAGADSPAQRAGGAATLVKLQYNSSANYRPNYQWQNKPIFTHEFDADTTARTYRYYVANESGIVSGTTFYLTADYVSSYSSETLYTSAQLSGETVFSTSDTVLDNWVEVGPVTPAVNSKVRIRIYSPYYHATARAWIDPLPVIY